MSKPGEELTTDEKFDSIRRDLRNLLDAYQNLQSRLTTMGQHLGQVEATASKAAAAVAALRDPPETAR